MDILNYQIPLFYILSLIFTYILINYIRQTKDMFQKKKQYAKMHKIAQEYGQKMKQKNQSIKIDLPNFSEQKMEQILNAPVTVLKQMLEKNDVTSVDLVKIFSKRCQTIGQSLNAITELNYEEAIQLATQCDELRKKDPQACKGHLFGIPISIKDTFDQKGKISTVGSVAQTLKPPCKDDGFNIKLLKKHGAIPFVRTNVPQFAMTFESNNYIFGAVQNPWDTSKCAGGSSGGEGASISSRCSPLGIGSDIGGSIRIPAAFCGIYALRPTICRGTQNGHTYYSDVFNGQEKVVSTCGPLGKSVDDLVLMMKCLNDSKNHEEAPIDEKDNYLIIKDIDDKIIQDKSKKRIGYFKTLRSFEASVANQRAVEIAVEKLKECGHELVQIELPFEEEFTEYCFKLFFAEGCQGFYRMLKGEELIPEYKALENLANMGLLQRKFMSFLLKLSNEIRTFKIVWFTKPLEGLEYFETVDKINKVRQKMFSLMKKYDIQAIITPSTGCPPFKHQQNADTFLSITYTFIWNILNFPSGVVPITTVQENEQHYDNCPIKDSITNRIKNYIKGTQGLPVGVQVVALPNQDEVSLNIMKQLDEKVQFYKNHQFPL